MTMDDLIDDLHDEMNVLRADFRARKAARRRTLLDKLGHLAFMVGIAIAAIGALMLIFKVLP
jgi:hypothetical protein